MIKYKNRILKLILPIVLCTIGSIVSCTNTNTEIGDLEIARYKDNVLMVKELKIAEYRSKEDSIQDVQRQIQSWFVKNALFEKALENIDGTENSIEKKVENYRAALYIYEYKQMIVQQKVDTVVEFNEIEEYYSKYGDEFKLHVPIIQSWVVKTPISITNESELVKLLKSNDVNSLGDLKTLCFQSARYYRFDSIWKPLSQLLVEVSGNNQTVNINSLSSGKVVQFSSDELVTFIKVINILNAGDKPPFEYIFNQIKDVIIQKRKEQFLSRLENDLLQNAIVQKKAVTH